MTLSDFNVHTSGVLGVGVWKSTPLLKFDFKYVYKTLSLVLNAFGDFFFSNNTLQHKILDTPLVHVFSKKLDRPQITVLEKHDYFRRK